MCTCVCTLPQPLGAQNAAVFAGSFLEYDWSDGDCVFANSTCFPEELMDALARQVGGCFRHVSYEIIATPDTINSTMFRSIVEFLPLESSNFERGKHARLCAPIVKNT